MRSTRSAAGSPVIGQGGRASTLPSMGGTQAGPDQLR